MEDEIEMLAYFTEESANLPVCVEPEAVLPRAAARRQAALDRWQDLLKRAFMTRDSNFFVDTMWTLRSALVAEFEISSKDASTQTTFPPWIGCPLPYQSWRGKPILNPPRLLPLYNNLRAPMITKLHSAQGEPESKKPRIVIEEVE